MTRRKLVARITLALAGAISIVLLADKPAFNGATSEFLSPDTFKTLLQFVLVTLGGGIVFLYLNIVKEEEEKRIAEDALKRELIRELDKLYRETKHIRRTLKAYCEQRAENVIAVDRKIFEDKLDKLDDIQISVEHAREKLESSDHLFSENECRKLSSAINYAARFLRSVFRDFQTRKAIRETDLIIIPQTCENLCDFLLSVRLPVSIDAAFDKMKDKNARMEERWEAFNHVKSGDRRYKIVSEECFKLAASQIDAALLTPKIWKSSNTKRVGTISLRIPGLTRVVRRLSSATAGRAEGNDLPV